jgi:hypothetical protein
VWSDPKFEMPWDYRKRMVFLIIVVFINLKYHLKIVKNLNYKEKLKKFIYKNSLERFFIIEKYTVLLIQMYQRNFIPNSVGN